MRFVSKSANLMIVLKPGYPGNVQMGTPGVNGIYVKFQSGIVDVKEESLIELMKNHKGYDVDFISVEEEEKDPFDYLRNESEPSHVITEIKYGHAEKSVGTPKKFKMPPEITEMINNQAAEIAKAMLPGMVKEVLMSMQGEAKADPQKKEVGETDGDTVKEKAPFCGSCDSKGIRHKRECPKNAPVQTIEE